MPRAPCDLPGLKQTPMDTMEAVWGTAETSLGHPPRRRPGGAHRPVSLTSLQPPNPPAAGPGCSCLHWEGLLCLSLLLKETQLATALSLFQEPAACPKSQLPVPNEPQVGAGTLGTEVGCDPVVGTGAGAAGSCESGFLRVLHPAPGAAGHHSLWDQGGPALGLCWTWEPEGQVDPV